MDYQAEDQVVENMEKETSDLAPTKSNKLFLKLKFSKSLIRCSQQHICSVCSKGFASGKALGGHIRIHNTGSKNGSHHRKISKLQQKKRNEAVDDLPLIMDQESNEKVSCCICNKDFRSMKSLFGHMKNHPERGWRGIRPPPSDKNSCCSSVSENDEALEVDQISCTATEKSLVSGSDLLSSLPKWTNTAKRCGKSINSDHDNEISEAACCLVKLARGDSFNLGGSSDGYQRTYSPTDNLTKDRTGSWSLGNKASKTGQFHKFPMKPDEEKGDPSAKEGRYRSRIFPSSQTPGSYSKNPRGGGLFETPMNETAASPAEGKTLTTFPKPVTQAAESSQVCAPKMLDFNQFQKVPMKPDEEDGDPPAKEGRYRSRIFPSSQTPGSYPKNPRGGELFETPMNETAASPAEGKTLITFPKPVPQAAESSQVCTPKMLDFHQFQKVPMKPDEEKGDPSAMEVSQKPGSYRKNSIGGLFEAPLIETASPAAESSQVRTPKILDFDLNEPYVPLDGEDIETRIN